MFTIRRRLPRLPRLLRFLKVPRFRSPIHPALATTVVLSFAGVGLLLSYTAHLIHDPGLRTTDVTTTVTTLLVRTAPTNPWAGGLVVPTTDESHVSRTHTAYVPYTGQASTHATHTHEPRSTATETSAPSMPSSVSVSSSMPPTGPGGGSGPAAPGGQPYGLAGLP